MEKMTMKKTLKWLIQKIVSDLNGGGINYSRIAHRTGLSSSTIQKLMVAEKRAPNEHTLEKLTWYYQKIYSTPELYGAQVLNYYNEHYETIKPLLNILSQQSDTLNLCKALLEHISSQRGF